MKRITMPPDLATRILTQVALRLEDLDRSAKGELTFIGRPCLTPGCGDGQGSINNLYYATINFNSVHLKQWGLVGSQAEPTSFNVHRFLEDDYVGLLLNAKVVCVEVLKPLGYRDLIEVIGGVAKILDRYPHISIAKFSQQRSRDRVEVTEVDEASRKLKTKYFSQPRVIVEKQTYAPLDEASPQELAERQQQAKEDDAVKPRFELPGGPLGPPVEKKMFRHEMCWCGARPVRVGNGKFRIICKACGLQRQGSGKLADMWGLWDDMIRRGSLQGRALSACCNCERSPTLNTDTREEAPRFSYICSNCGTQGAGARSPRAASIKWNRRVAVVRACTKFGGRGRTDQLPLNL